MTLTCFLPVSYTWMEPVVGGSASLLVSYIFVKTGTLVASGASIGGVPIWQVALGIHIAAWILQFIGHGVFEGNLY